MRETPEERAARLNRRMTPGAHGGRSAQVAPVRRELPLGETYRPPADVNGLRPATVVVAPSTCPDMSRADVVLDGSTDAATIATVVASLGSAGKVLFLDGDIYMSGTDSINDTGRALIFEGMGQATIVHTTGNSSVLVITGTGSAIRHMAVIVESASPTGASYVFAGGTFSELYDVTVINATSSYLVAGIRQDSYRGIVRGCTVLDVSLGINLVGARTLAEGNFVRGVNGIVTSGDGSIVIGNHLVGETLFSAAAVAGIQALTDSLIAENHVDLFGLGIQLNGDNVQVVANRVMNSTQDGIRAESGCDDVAILDNFVIGSGTAANNTWSNICVGPHGAGANLVNQAMVGGNVCRKGTNTNKPKYGLFIETTATNTYDTGNDLYQSGVTASRLDSGAGTVVGATDRL